MCIFIRFVPEFTKCCLQATQTNKSCAASVWVLVTKVCWIICGHIIGNWKRVIINITIICEPQFLVQAVNTHHIYSSQQSSILIFLVVLFCFQTMAHCISEKKNLKFYMLIDSCGIFYVRLYSVFLLEVLLSDGELYVTPVELRHDHVTGFGQWNMSRNNVCHFWAEAWRASMWFTILLCHEN